MRINKALIVADPWIGYLLDGTKDWEMRSSGASLRGWFGLIRKGTGAVHGVARLVDVGAPLSQAQMLANVAHHRIPEHMILSGEVARWNIPWKLADVRRLARPVPYRHKSGAVTWVELDDDAIAGIAAQLGGWVQSHPSSVQDEVKVDIRQRGRKLHIQVEWDDGQADRPRAVPRRPQTSVATTRQPEPVRPARVASPSSSGGRVIGEVELTAGNIAHSHIYLRSFFDRFPADAVGGSNKSEPAKRTVLVDWGRGAPVETDLDGKKKFFRARGWIKSFMEANRAAPGDVVVITEQGPYRYRVSIKGRMAR